MKGTPTWLRAQNDRTAFRLLLEHGPLSRSQLGELSGMSKPTAGQMITRLERIGLIVPAGEVTGARGPNAVSYGVRRDALTGVAVSILADRIQAVLVDPSDTVHPVAEFSTAGRDRSPAHDVRAAVAAACAASGVSPESVSAVTVGVQAAVDEAGDALSFTDTLPGWPRHGARTLIESATGLAVTLENDVNLATMAERAAAGIDTDFVHVWLGDGIGAGLFVGGVVLRGEAGGAGELGYLAVPRTAAAIDPAAEDLTDLAGAPGVLAVLGAAPQESLAAALPRLAGDEAALAALADRVTTVLQPVLALLAPPCIVLGGPTATAGGAALAALVADRLALPHNRVRSSQVVGDPGPVLLGARTLLVADLRARLEHQIVEEIG